MQVSPRLADIVNQANPKVAVLREVMLEGVHLRGEAGDPGLTGVVGQAVAVHQLSRNICARPGKPGRKR